MENWQRKIVQTLLRDLKLAAQFIINRKGLSKQSDAWKSIEWELRDNIFKMWANHYMIYIDSGRKPNSRFPPPQAIIDWIRKNNIRPRDGKMSINQLAFLIGRAIAINGIKGKHFIDDVISESQDIIASRITTQLAEEIVDEIVKAIEE